MSFFPKIIYSFLLSILLFTSTFGQKAISIKPVLITRLPAEVNETSGLLWVNNTLFSHNDKGGKNILYALDSGSGSIIRRITIPNIENNDWEDLTHSNEHIFIGDMGNNKGKRGDLSIHMIKKKDIFSPESNKKVLAQTISFYYPEQRDLKKSKDHNFDCEAIIYADNKLYLFTKNRIDHECNLYFIPAKPGRHEAQLISRFDTGGLITGAEISPSGKKVILIGYNKKADVFLWILENFKGNDYFSGSKTLVSLGKFRDIGQAEAVCFTKENTVLISSEAIEEVPASLYKINLDNLYSNK